MPQLSDIARALGVPMPAGIADRSLRRIAALDDGGPDDLGYIASDRYFDRLRASSIGTLIASAKLELPQTNAAVLRVADAEIGIAQALALFAMPAARPPRGVHPSAVVSPTAQLAEGVAVGPNVSIADGATLGRNVVLHANVVIGAESVVGDDCEFFPNVVLRERVTVGGRVTIHANSTIGTDGFGYRWDGKQHLKIPQIGTVVIEDDVEIGSGTCIDRAKFGETRVGRGTKIDNQVQIGHNVRIGAHCIICGHVGIAGSTTLGNGVVMGGGSAAADHVTIADRVTLAARAAVAGTTRAGEVLSGAPAIPHRDWLRQQVHVRNLPELASEVRALAAEVERLKNKRN